MPERFRNIGTLDLVIPRFGIVLPTGAEFDAPDDDQDSLANQPLLLRVSGDFVTAAILGALASIRGAGATTSGALVALDSPSVTPRNSLAEIRI